MFLRIVVGLNNKISTVWHKVVGAQLIVAKSNYPSFMWLCCKAVFQ